MLKLPPVYLITDRQQLAPGKQLPEVLEELLQAGVRMLQLREKDLSAAQLLPIATQVRQLTSRYDCFLLINDRIDIALAVDADGVHLGGHSVPVATARKLLGPDKLIGVSTHSPGEIQTAAQQGADFVTYGPVYHTPSKAAYGAPVGLNNLARACCISNLPVYGLGGIKADNAAAVFQSGASGIALISTLIAAPSPGNSYRQLVEQIKSHITCQSDRLN